MKALGVASDAADFISLGIAMSQDLLQYYGSDKDVESGVADMYESIEALTQILLLLLLAFENGNLNSNGVVVVEKSIASCQQGIEKIEKKLDKVKVTSMNPSRREKIKAQFRKTPSLFKENTLIKLKANWERAAR